MLELTEQQRRGLMALRRGPGYDALLDVMQKLCEVAETELLRMNRAAGHTGEQILSAQEQCRAGRVYFEKAQLEIEAQIKALEEQDESKATRIAAAGTWSGALSTSLVNTEIWPGDTFHER